MSTILRGPADASKSVPLQAIGAPATLLQAHPRLCALGGAAVFVLRTVQVKKARGLSSPGGGGGSGGGNGHSSANGGSGGDHSEVVLRVEELDCAKWPREAKWRPVVDMCVRACVRARVRVRVRVRVRARCGCDSAASVPLPVLLLLLLLLLQQPLHDEGRSG